jgi:phosphate transport system protein
MRSRYDKQLAQLNDALIKMGACVEASIADAGKALVEHDRELAEKVMATDDDIDHMEIALERMCLKIILTQQPVANDLRLVTSVLKMTTDLERIGDHASDISGIVIKLSNGPYIKELEHIPLMMKTTMKMVTESISAFVNEDEVLARAVIASDDEVNRLFATVKEELTGIINAGTVEGGQILDLLMIAKYFERIGDHATNIAEWVIFTLTGVHRENKMLLK